MTKNIIQIKVMGGRKLVMFKYSTNDSFITFVLKVKIK